MLDKILEVLESEDIIYDYEIISDNDINIIANNIVYNFKQEGNSFTLNVAELTEE